MYISRVETYTVYYASVEYTGNAKEIPQMTTLALLPGAKPQTLASEIISHRPNHMLPVASTKLDKTMARGCARGERKTEEDRDPD